ncbi:MAG TPA: apolipoprotein N-acyltransferase, partial [Bacteroidales bacterium]|nr:apolipoprotein N-acyltransferase [Bacteroidales bacterium]
MKKGHLVLLSILSGLLLSLAWPARGFPFLLFIAFVPLLYIEDFIAKNRHNFIKSSVFFYAYIAFFIWNALTTWWIYYSTTFGVSMAVVLNSLFMAVTFLIYHLIRRTVFKSRGGYYILILLWISFEFLHLDWDLTWSWLNLGNGFANYPEFVQWYEFTGVFGGDIWILLFNILFYKLLTSILGRFKSRKDVYLYGTSSVLLMAIPIALSLTMYYSYSEKEAPYRCVVVQPNVDPYGKFTSITIEEQLNSILGLAKQKVDNNTDFLVCPETALPEYINENEMEESASIDSLKSLISKHPKLKIVIGISSFKIFNEGEKLSRTARYSERDKYYYDVCNTALYLDSAFVPQLYHKSKLVPGVEMMPFPKLLKPLAKFAIDLGGMTGSNGTQEERTAFGAENSPCKVAPVICYESIYGDFVTGYIRNGANLIFIITNDGWWENTAGHRQHFQYARLRAIETRRSIARAANTGISAYINQKGDVFMPTAYWSPEVMTMAINANSRMTFYARYGDYLGKIALYLSAALIVLFFTAILLNKRKRLRIKKKNNQA